MYDDDYTPVGFIGKMVDIIERVTPVIAILVIVYIIVHFVVKYW